MRFDSYSDTKTTPSNLIHALLAKVIYTVFIPFNQMIYLLSVTKSYVFSYILPIKRL